MIKQKQHFIYRTTCLVTSKFYVGMHSTDNLDDGYLGSGTLLGYSRQKYGDENHSRQILEFLPSRKELKAREKQLVNEELLSDPLCLNIAPGGDGGLRGKEHAKKFHRGGWEAMNRNKDHHATALKTGRTIKARVASGQLHYVGTFTDRTHSEATKLQMCASHRGKHIGQKNSQFGTCWVTNGVKPIKIEKEQLVEYLDRGYSRGRRINA